MSHNPPCLQFCLTVQLKAPSFPPSRSSLDHPLTGLNRIDYLFPSSYIHTYPPFTSPGIESNRTGLDDSSPHDATPPATRGPPLLPAGSRALLVSPRRAARLAPETVMCHRSPFQDPPQWGPSRPLGVVPGWGDLDNVQLRGPPRAEWKWGECCDRVGFPCYGVEGEIYLSTVTG